MSEPDDRCMRRVGRAARPARHLAALVLSGLVLLVLAASAAAQVDPDPADPTTTSESTVTTAPTSSTSSTAAPSTATEPTATTPGSAPTPSSVAPDRAPVTPPLTGGQEPGPSTSEAQRPDDGATTTLPAAAPDGFTDEQFRTFVAVVEACGGEPGAVCRQVLAWTGNRALAEAAQWVATVPLAIVAVVLVALAANWLVRRGISGYLRRLDARAARHEGPDGPGRLVAQRRALRMATISSTLGSAASVVIFVVAVFAALAQLDISLGPLLAGAGIVGAALGFGAQNLVRDFLAGLFVTIEDQYGVGDIIDVGRASGVVEGITLRMTKLRDVEGTLWFVPNGEVKEVGNMTQRWSRVILDIAVAYDADHHEAGRLIKQAADDMWRDPHSGARLLEEPELWGIESLGEGSVVMRVAVKSYPADQWDAARELRSRIKDSFDAAGIEFPLLQPALWARQGRDTADA